MTLDTQIAADGPMFVDTDDFGESVTYYPHTHYRDAARANRSISATVIRESYVDDDGAVVPVFHVYVHNNTTTGINSDELDIGGDQIGIPLRPGEAAEQRSVTRLIEQDKGMLVLECQ